MKDSLKNSNLKLLVSLAALDMAIALSFAYPHIAEAMTISRVVQGSVVTLLPVAILLLVEVASPNLKAVLVFWKVENALPGHAAFTTHGPSDPRIDMSALQRHVGKLPVDPKEQNATWYRLYKRVESDTRVVGAHKSYLLWRDAASLSLLLSIVVPFVLWCFDATSLIVKASLVLFAVQYILTALASRNSGNRFVCNVLALHAAKRITAAPRA
ncbi:hypothetical protein AKI39_03290 [Bordetella sp. H567]|uniref:hypothetical protein n=1 Tax=Bordetella sp. H567 TaxID=1697043 RepID=UPI00081C7EA5|nr:hypothetical protein [Bordetella sp. H567]AOB29922.1 hypothetical protein AKI39_03290 [Bordetella sp. H567]